MADHHDQPSGAPLADRDAPAGSAGAEILRVEGCAKTFAGPQGPVRALHRVDLAAAAGEIIALRGPSGSGKSTLLMICGGMLRPDGGRVLLAGDDLYRLSTAERNRARNQRIGMVFQRFHLIPWLSALGNAGLAGAAAGGDPAAAAAAEDWCRRLGLGHRLHHLPGQLSVGERQRCALARAMASRPRLLLADEPTGNLDADTADAVRACLRTAAAGGAAVIVATHDEATAALAGRSLQLG